MLCCGRKAGGDSRIFRDHITKTIFQEKREGHKKIFKIIDKDHDGYIDMEEIKAWWTEEDSSRSVLKAMEDLWSMDSKYKKVMTNIRKNIYKYQAWTATTTAGSVSRSG